MVVCTCLMECMTRSYVRAWNKYTLACAHTLTYTNTVQVVHAQFIYVLSRTNEQIQHANMFRSNTTKSACTYIYIYIYIIYI